MCAGDPLREQGVSVVIRYPKAIAFAICAALGLGLVALVLVSFTPPAQAQTQAPAFRIEALYSGLPQVYEGTQVRFRVTRTAPGGPASDATVEVEVWEPNLDDGGGNNPSLQTLQFTFHAAEATSSRTFEVVAYVDGVDESAEASHILKAKLVASSDGSYTLDAQDEAQFTVLDPPSAMPRISIAKDSTSIAEGDAASFTLTRTGDTASPLTVQVSVDDTSGFTRGDYWEPPPMLPTTVEFGANSSTATVSLQTLDDHRDLPNGSITLEVKPVRMQQTVPYLLGHTGSSTAASTTVTDNDTAQELELNFGKDGVNDANVSEGDKLAFVVKRRQQDADTGNPAAFTVRIETDRGSDDWRLSDWTEDAGTGRLYKDYPLQLTGSDLEVKEEFTVTANGQPESNWDYRASIRPLQNHAGEELTDSQEAEYWTVKSGFRETAVDATDGGASNGTISIESDVATVIEGQAVVYTLYRVDGPMNRPVTVRVRTREPNRSTQQDNPSTQDHYVTIEAWKGHADFTVYPYIDGAAEAGEDLLIAVILSVNQVDGDVRYTVGQPDRVDVEINDPPGGSAFVTVAANSASVAEGGSATFTFTRTGGDTAQPLTVNVLVDDPEDRLRGNHWEPAPAIPTQVTFPANATTQTFTLNFPDDQRNLADNGSVSVRILSGTDYLLQETGNEGKLVSITVSDNDTAQELTLRWGRISPDSVHWEAGESYLTCSGGSCTPGPAEGTFYYEDGRSFAVSQELAEPHPAHFLVSRRAADTGKTATFVVRVEHNRGWDSPRHSGWPTDPETGNRYQEFPMTLTGNQRQVVGRIELLDNGIVDHNLWQYSAEIKQIEDASTGSLLSASDEAQYWTVSGGRKKTIFPDLVLGTLVKIDSVSPKQVPEGQAVTITLERRFGNLLEPYPVQVRTWEPNQVMADGTNPAAQVHDVVFPAIPMTDQFVEYVTQTETLTVDTWDDSVYEPRDTFMSSLLVPSVLTGEPLLLSTKTAVILDDDRPTITLSVDDTSITEGDTATFTLTRGHNTADELLVGVSMDDPGGFLAGNFASEAVAVPSSIMFAAGETTREVAITPPDDWRDIPDNAITFTVIDEPHYDIVGSTSLTVQVADNDMAPQVSISFNHAEVEEGTDLTLEITRTGEDKNPLEIPITAGPVGDQQYHVFGMDAGMSLLHFTYRQPDDSFKGPDHHYSATLQPGRAEFWVPAGPATVTGAILDNDAYTVSVEALGNSVDEGNLLYYRVSHDGHTGESLQVKVDHTETGNSVYDSTLGNQTHTIHAGSSSTTRAYLTHRNDGYDDDAEFTVELLADDAYEIDSGNSSASIIVRNKDPLPVLGFRDTGTVVSEGVGTVDIWVDLLAAVNPLKTVTVDYGARDHYTGDGLNIIHSNGTLTFAPGDTSAAVTVEVLQNSIAGYRDRFHVVLSNPVNAVLQDGVVQLVHHAVIEDDESVVTVEAQAEAVDEGSDVVLTLTRDGNTADELTVWLQVTKTAPQAESRRDTVVFPAGDATVEHTITTTDDGQRNGSHTVTATLLDPPAIGELRTYWVARPSGSSDTVTVRETHLETVTLLTPDLRVAEGESITLELARSGATPLTVTLEVTETGDYTTGTLPETVSFGLREGSATVTIQTENDTTAEDIGKLTVTLVDGTNYRAGWPNSHTFTIYDDDSVKPSVSVTKDQAWVNEGQPVSFTVARSTPADNALQARLELNRVRYRVTQADLDDPTRGITTPLNHIHFDTEEIPVEFAAGTRTVTVTRPTTDDSLNYGNSTYHATVLNDSDDDYTALHNASASIWVQDDDIPTVTGSQTTSEFYDGRYQVVLPFTRTGDVSGRLPLDYDRTYTGHRPAPLQDETETRTWIKGHGFEPGNATGVSIGDLGYTKALGRSGTLDLEPYYCPNNPSACGYYPQYQVGTPSSITYRYYSNTMGVRIKRDQASVAEGETATFTLHRHGGKPDALTRPLEVTVNVSQEGEYISGSAPQTVSFAANQSTATLSVPTADDGVDEADGAIIVELEYTWSRGCDDEHCYRQKEYQGSPWYVRSVTTAVTDDDLPGVSVSDAQAGEADGTMEFTVSLSQANNERVASVDWATAEDGSTTAATSGADFTTASGTLNFAVGETEKTVAVTLLDDQLDEADETFNVVLSNPSELTLADHTGTGIILDDDIGYGIAFSGSIFHTEEGDDVLVSLRRLVPQEPGGVCYVTIQGRCFSVATEGDLANGAITVNLDITQAGDFLSSLPTTVTFAQGAAEVEISLSTVDDSTVEADGSLRVNILEGTDYSPVYIGPPDSQDQGTPYRTLYLYDNDLAFSIDDAQADESAGQVDFSVSLNEPAPQQVTVDVATMDGEATSHGNVTATSLGQDFVARSETLTFAAGEQTRTFAVVILDDTIHERNETFTVELTTPSRSRNRYNSALRWSTLTSLADGTGLGTIVDDEQELIASVSRAYPVVSEDHAGPARFTVELSHPVTTASERNPAVAWRTAPGTAALDEDYQGEDGKLTFKPGVNTKFIEVDIVDDNLFESALETFRLELVADDSRFVTISSTNAAFEASIRDNETLKASVAANAETVAEGNDVTFTVALTGGVPADDVSVTFETAGTATVTDDYAAPKGAITFPPGDASGKAGVLEISAGQSRGTITFPVLADGIDDDDETLKVEIFSVATDQRAGSVSATDNVATTTILDQDSLTVSIQDAPSVTEGAVATFTITLSTASGQDISAGWSTKEPGDALDAGETAVPDRDYTAASGTVSIPAGDRSATFTVTTTQDTLAEGAETFVVTLEEATIGNSSPPEMVPLGVTNAEVTITDDDTAPTGLTISSASPSWVDEDAGATDITVTVALDGTTQFTVGTPVTVQMIDRPGVQNNAALGVDYTATTANATIPAGESSVTAVITLTPVDDSLSEDDEIARLSAKSTVFSGSTGKGVKIIDNDVEPGQVILTVAPDTVAESASSVQLNVTGTLDGVSSRVVDTVVSLSLADDTATAGVDYQAATATLTIPAGQMSATAQMTLTVLDDSIAEGDETLEVTGTVPGTITVTPDEVVIEDDDQEPTGISLTVTTGPIDEDGGAKTIPVRATLVGGGTRSVDTAVAMSVLDVSATVTDDYTAAWDSSTLTIPAGEFSATANLTLTPVDDTLYEGDEQIAVRGANADPGLPVNGVRLSILDNDPQPTTVILSLDTDTVLEGSGTHFPVITATLEGDSTLTSHVNLTVNLKGDTERSQSYTAYLFSPLSIEAGQSSGTADLWVIGTDDDVEDEDETVTIEGASDHPDLTVVAAQLTIANDDTSGVRVSPTSLTVREGERKFYSVALTSEPTSDVVLTVDVPANAGFTVSPGTVTFGPRSWGWKRVYVTGIEDPDADDEPAAEISHSLSSSDTKYAGAASDNVAITVKDIASASVVVAPTELGIGEGGSDAYTVVLDTQPTGDVTVTVSGFAGTALTLDKTTLTFTTSDWNVEQTVTVTAGQDDNAAEEIIPLANTVSGGGYDGITADSVVVTVTDDDTAGVTVRPTAITVVGDRSNEYTVVLETEPAGDVTVTIAGVTGTDLSLDQTTLTFTDQDWDTPQVVTVSAAANAAADTATLTHAVSSADDTDYDVATADSVAVSILQAPDGPLVQVGVTASDQELTVPEGESRTYSIVLASQPLGDVAVAIAGVTNTDLTTGDSSLTFTTTDWNVIQTVTVAAAHDDDAVDEDVVNVTHTVTSANDSNYDGIAVENVLVTVTDDDTAGVTVSETSLEIEEGDSDTYTVVLDTEPIGDVTVTIGGIADTEISLDKTTLTFTASNWNTAQTVRVTAEQDDDAIDEDVVTLTHTVSSTADNQYDGIAAGSVAVTVTDDEVPTPDFTLTMAPPTHGDTDGDGNVNLGDKLTYAAVASNTGTVELSNIRIKHALVNPAGTDCGIMRIGTTCTVPIEYTIVQADVDVGTVTNTATATADGVDERTASQQTPVHQVKDLEIEKTTTADGFAATGESVPYSYRVTNAGTVTLSGTLEIADDKIESGDITCPSVPGSGIAPGAFLTCAGSYTTIQADVDAGEVTNEATAALDGVTSGSDSVTVNWVAPQGTEPQLTVSSGEDDEDEGSFVFTVTLNPSSLQTVTVDYATGGGTATSGSDYTPASGSLTFAPGDTTKDVTVTIADDDVDESDETFNLTLSDAVNAIIPIPTGTATIKDDDTAGVTVSEASLDINEGDSDTYTVVLESEPTHSVTITVNDPSNTDVTAEPADLTFTLTNWDTAQTVTVTAAQDSGHDDEDATVTHTGASSDTKYNSISVADVLVNVTDDDDVPVTVSFGQAAYTVAEGNSVTVKVVLSADPERTVEVPITVTNMDGATTADYSGIPESVVFNNGETEKMFDLEATDDAVDDDGEGVRLTFGTLPPRVTSTGPSQAVVSITDDDVPDVTVSFEQASYTVAEGGTVTVKVVLSANPERTVTIPLTKTNQDGASSSDYSSVPGSIVFNRGETEKTFDFQATDDALDDDGESVKFTFGTLPAGVSSTNPSQTVVSITDHDVPSVTVTFASASHSIAEGESATITVTLSAAPERVVTIPITAANQDGASASDYSGIPADVQFTSSQTVQTFTITATDDAADDDDESVKLSFGTLPLGVTQGTITETIVTIVDNDVPPVTVSFGQSEYNVAEGNTVTMSVTLSADPERTVEVPITVTTMDGAETANFSGVPETIVFNSGETEHNFDFAATQDTVDDSGEAVRLTFGTLPTRVSSAAPSQAVVSITDDDTAGVTISETSLEIEEGDSDDYTVVLESQPTHDVTITVNDSSNTDVTAEPASLTFTAANWDTAQTVTVTAAQDGGHDDEDATVTHTAASSDANYDGISVAGVLVNVTDDDDVPVTVSFEQASYTVAEGNNVTIKVKLSADPERTVTIPLTKANQGGASGSDYSGVPTNVVFNSGDTEKTFDLEAIDDTVDDDGESIKLGFGSSLPTDVTEGSPDETVVSITDDDVPSVTVSFEQATYTVAEGSNVTVKVKLSTDPERTVTIPLTKTTQGGASSSDYSSVPGNVVFNSGDTEKTFGFEATQDTVDDDGESVRLGFGSSLPAGVSEGTTNETVVSITDDDVPPVTVSFGQSSYTVAEGNSVRIKVVLSADPERTVEVPLTVTNVDGAAAADYSGIPASLTFNSGDTEKTFDFQATQDTVDDDDERVRLTFGTLPGRVNSTSPSQAVVSITDDDMPPVTVSFEQAAYTVAEGNSVTVKVILSADPERTVTIPISPTGQDGASASDYSVPNSIAFNSGDTEKTFDFEADDDEENDDGESVKLTFGGLPAGVSEGTTNQTVVSISDNDSNGGLPGGNREIPGEDGEDITVSFEQASYSVREGSTTTIKVVLSADPQRSISIPLTATNGPVLTSGDYSGVPASADFVSGDTEKSFTLTAVQDQDDENDETLTLGFGTLPAGLINGDTTETSVTIVDSIHVSFGAANYQAYEGGPGAYVTVNLDSPAPLEIVIPITAAGKNGATSNDWTGVPTSLTFTSGDTRKAFTLMAYDDEVEDGGESVELGFGTLPAGVARGTPSVSTVELMNMETPTCETAVWCATAEFAYSGSRDWGRTGLGLGYHPTQDPYHRHSSLSDNRFTFRGKEYQVWSMFTTPGMHPDVGPGAPGRIPEYSTFKTTIMEVAAGELKNRVDRDHQRDWTLHIGGIALPFTNVADPNQSGTTFVWHHPKLQDLFSEWTDGNTYEIMIAEDPVSERPEPPVTAPTAPRYLRVIPGDGSVTATWKQPLKDGNSDITHYRLQWKPGTESWSNPNAVGEVAVQPFGGSSAEVFHTITGLTNYTHYTVRVIAVNGVGDSEPSGEHFGMPQEEPLAIADTVVNGNQLTITYERTLDGSSVPSQDSYRVLVNGAPRNVTGVSISGRSVMLTLEEPAKRAIKATDEVEFRYVTPPSGAPAIRDNDGNYAYSCEFGEPPSEARNESDPGLLEPVTAELKMVPASHSGPASEVIFQIEFSEPVRVDMGPNRAYLLDVEGGTVTSAWWIAQDTTRWEVVLVPDDNHDIEISLHEGRSCQEKGAPCASGGRILTTRLEDTINGSEGIRPRSTEPEQQDDGKKKSDGEQPNQPAGGKVRMQGEARVGQTLTADTSGIADEDGLENAQFSYQWIAGGADIEDATGQTYTLTADEEGLKIQVFVSFTDDAGYPEALTSQPTVAVEPEHTNTPATGQPVIQGEARVGQTLTADTSGIADEDGLENAEFSYQWIAGGADIEGATAATYTLTEEELELTVTVWVSFSDDMGSMEALVSDPSGAVVPENPPPAPTNLAATVNEDGSITLTWDAPDDNTITGYRILRRLPDEGEEGFTVIEADTDTTATSFTDTDVKSGARHVYRVKGINANGPGKRSKPVRVDP